MDPVREVPKPHECVCLMTKKVPGPLTLDALHKLATNTGSAREVVNTFREVRDKCYAEVDNPDQAFCQSCEDDGHPHDENQIGLRNIHQRGKNT